MKGRLGSNSNFKCKRCKGEAMPICAKPLEIVAIGEEFLDVVDTFCYLGDMISAGGGAEESSIARIRSGWKKFRELLPVLTSRNFSLCTKGKVFNSQASMASEFL